MKKLIVLISILTASIFAYANTEKAPGVFKEVIVTGYGDSADSAKTNACRKAVKMVVGEYLDVATEAKNDDFAESIIALSAGYIESTKELAPPTKNADGIWSVKISALVKVEKVRERVARFRISENLVDFSKFKSKKEREDAILQYIFNYSKEFLKLMTIAIEGEPDNKGGMLLKMKAHADARQFMDMYKAYIKGLKSAGLTVSTDWDDISSAMYHRIILSSGRTFYYGFPKGYEVTHDFRARYENVWKGYYIVLKIEFLDKDGEVLQEYEYLLGFDNDSIYIRDVDSLFVGSQYYSLSDFFCYDARFSLLRMRNKMTRTPSVKFDIPEDVEKVKSIRNTIVVRRKNK